MKNIVLFLILLVPQFFSAQDSSRIKVAGKLLVESDDIGGVTIFNASTDTGTITDNNGEFTLNVGLNDLIEVSALQYRNVNFRVNEDILESRSMKIFLIEEINRLNEVIVFSKGLTGDLQADVRSKKAFSPKLDLLYFGVKNKDEFEFEADNKSQVTNVAISGQDRPMVNGLNIINVVDQLLLPLFRSNAKGNKDADVPDVPVKSIKYYFGSEFISDNFDIPEHRVEEFIRFVEDENFDYNLLNYGREMEFLELLHQKSMAFREP